MARRSTIHRGGSSSGLHRSALAVPGGGTTLVRAGHELGGTKGSGASKEPRPIQIEHPAAARRDQVNRCDTSATSGAVCAFRLLAGLASWTHHTSPARTRAAAEGMASCSQHARLRRSSPLPAAGGHRGASRAQPRAAYESVCGFATESGRPATWAMRARRRHWRSSSRFSSARA